MLKTNNDSIIVNYPTYVVALERNVDPLVDPDRNTDRGAPPSRT